MLRRLDIVPILQPGSLETNTFSHVTLVVYTSWLSVGLTRSKAIVNAVVRVVLSWFSGLVVFATTPRVIDPPDTAELLRSAIWFEARGK